MDDNAYGPEEAMRSSSAMRSSCIGIIEQCFLKDQIPRVIYACG